LNIDSRCSIVFQRKDVRYLGKPFHQKGFLAPFHRFSIITKPMQEKEFWLFQAYYLRHLF